MARRTDRVSAEEKSQNRDYLMARLAAAISELDHARAAALDALHHFVDPDNDTKGEERDELMDAAHDHAANAVRSFELIDEFGEPYDTKEAEPEPDDDGEDGDDEDDEGDEDGAESR